MEDDTLPPKVQELVDRMITAMESNRAAIADLYTKYGELSPSKNTGNSFTPIRENGRGESLLNVTENFGSPGEVGDMPRFPSNTTNSRATFGTSHSSVRLRYSNPCLNTIISNPRTFRRWKCISLFNRCHNSVINIILCCIKRGV